MTQPTAHMPRHDKPAPEDYDSSSGGRVLSLVILLLLMALTGLFAYIGNIDYDWVAVAGSIGGVFLYIIGMFAMWKGRIYRIIGWVAVIVCLAWLVYAGISGNKTSSGLNFGSGQTTRQMPASPTTTYRSPLDRIDGPSLDELGPTQTPTVAPTSEPEDTVPTFTEQPVPTTTTEVTPSSEEESPEPVPPAEDAPVVPVVPDIPAQPNVPDPSDQNGSGAQPEDPTYDPNQSNNNGGNFLQGPG